MNNQRFVIKRYNQGFGNFGPMEQCNDGKWIEVTDDLINQLNLASMHDNLINERKKYYDGLLKEYKLKWKAIVKLELTRNLLIVSMSINLFAVAFIIALLKVH